MIIQKISKLPKSKYSQIAGTILVLAIGNICYSWSLKQQNIHISPAKIEKINAQIDNLKLPITEHKEILAIKKDILSIDKEIVAAQNSIYLLPLQALIQVMGVLLLTITTYIGLRNLKVTEDKYIHDLDIIKTSGDEKVTERFGTAIEHLGSDKVDIRLGGIYSLEQIGIDSPCKYHWTTIEILSAFVREKSLLSKESNSAIVEAIADIQAAMTVLGRSKVTIPSNKKINLRGTDLRFIELIDANLSNFEFNGADFTNAKLSGINLTGANLIETNFTEADLSNANLTDAIFSGANLTKIDFSNANLTGAKLSGADLSEAELNGADLSVANLSNVILSGAELSGSSLNEADLSRAVFIDANLTDANLTGANMNEAFLLRANLTGANLKKAKNLTHKELGNAIGGSQHLLSC